MVELKAKYQKILSSSGVQDEISKVVIESPENLVGEHMASICEYVSVHFKNESKAPKYFFLKRNIPMDDKEREGMFKAIMMTEGKFLTKFISEMAELCDSKLGVDNNVRIRNLFPKVYYCDENEIIMENMATEPYGYFMMNKMDLQNFEMAKLVIKGLAKLHGISYCLIKQEGGGAKYLEKYPDFRETLFESEAEEMLSKMFEPTFELILAMMKESKNNSLETAAAFEKLNVFKGNLVPEIIKGLRSPSLFDSVNHGDCWNNNMMFSPETKRDPSLAKLLFVDLQIARINSPCLDIAYFLFTSTKPEVRARSRDLLKIYFDTISPLVTSLGEEFPFTFQDFLKDYGNKSRMGFFFGLMMVMTLDSIKKHDTAKSGGNMEDEFNVMIKEWIKNNKHKVDEVIEDVVSKVNVFEMFGKL